MSLADWFYTLAIIYMGMGIVLLIALVIGVFYIKKKITDMHRTFDEKLHIVSQAVNHPAEAAVDMGASLAEAAIEKLKSALDKNTKKTSAKHSR